VQPALVTGRQIGMAISIPMEGHRLAPEQALHRLRDVGQGRSVKLRDLVEQVNYTWRH
jgi:hypothetical protein